MFPVLCSCNLSICIYIANFKLSPSWVVWEMRFLLTLGYLLDNKEFEQKKKSMHSIVIYIICYALHHVFIIGKFSIKKWKIVEHKHVNVFNTTLHPL
jgi:hypothetical protein